MASLESTESKKSNATKLAKKFKCHLCDRCFTRSEHRARHELSHNPERPWQCDICSSAFVRRDLLLRHSRTVHGAGSADKMRRRKRQKTRPRDSPVESDQAQPPPPASDQDDTMTPHTISEHPEQSPISPNMHGQPAANGLMSLATMSTANPDVTTAMLITGMQRPPFSNMGYSYGTHPQNYAFNKDPMAFPPSARPYMRAGADKDTQNLDDKNPDMLPQAMHGGLTPVTPWHPSMYNSVGSSRSPSSHPLFQPHWRSDDNGEMSYKTPGSYPPVQGVRGTNDELDHMSRMLGSEYDQGAKPMPGAAAVKDRPSTNASGVNGNQRGTSRIPQLNADFDMHGLRKLLRRHPASTQSLHHPELTRLQMNRYLSAYFNFFHPTVPMVHLQTFNCAQASPSLLLAMCAVGATLCLEDEAASFLSYNSRMTLDMLPEQSDNASTLMMAQSIIIITVMSAYSGERSSLDSMGTLRTSLVRLTDFLIQRIPVSQTVPQHDLGWVEWISEQEIIRTYFSALVAVTTLSAVFHFPTTFSVESLPQELPLPCSETLWNTTYSNELTWRSHYHADNSQKMPVTIGQILDLLNNVATDADIMSQSLPVLNPFSVRILSNVLFMRVTRAPIKPEAQEGHMRQIRLWQLLANDTAPGRGQGALLTIANLPFLQMADALDTPAMGGLEKPSPILVAMRTQQHPMIILGHVVISVTRLHLTLDLSIVRENLKFLGPHHVADAAFTCMGSLQSKAMILELGHIVAGLFDVLRIPCLIGTPMTLAFLTAPPSCMISGLLLILAFELNLALIMWCYRVEEQTRDLEQQDQLEALPEEVLSTFRWIDQTCADAGIEKTHGSLAVALAETVASLYDAIQTWHLAKIMASSLRLFAQGLAPNAQYDQSYSEGPLSYEYLSYS